MWEFISNDYVGQKVKFSKKKGLEAETLEMMPCLYQNNLSTEFSKKYYSMVTTFPFWYRIWTFKNSYIEQ